MKVRIYNQHDFIAMQKVGSISASILDELESFVKPGITTNQINDFVHKRTLENKCIPAPLNYHGFPKSVCTSLNDVICHGIPDETILKDGDILNVDVTCILNGYYGDTSRMYCIGESFADANKLQTQKKIVHTTYRCLMEAIKVVRPGNKLLDIATTIQKIAEENNFFVVRDFCGHGIGKNFHESPNILHCVFGDLNYYNFTLKEGMIFTIEPMINEKSWQAVVDKKDKWTARTIDGGLSAQFEHTLGVTDKGCVVFTLSN